MAMTGCLYLDFQDIVSANALVVHFMIGIIGIATIFILNKGEPISHIQQINGCGSWATAWEHLQAARSRARGRDIASNKTTIPKYSYMLANAEQNVQERVKWSNRAKCLEGEPRLAESRAKELMKAVRT